jgi:hypothetical protein
MIRITIFSSQAHSLPGNQLQVFTSCYRISTWRTHSLVYKSTTLRQRQFGRQPVYRHTTDCFPVALLAAKNQHNSILSNVIRSKNKNNIVFFI